MKNTITETVKSYLLEFYNKNFKKIKNSVLNIVAYKEAYFSELKMSVYHDKK